jgi:hypothetical protein
MKHRQVEGPAASTGAGAPTRLQQTQQYLFTHYGILEEAAYDTHQLSVWDCKAVLELLSSKLPTYKGPVNAAAFERWATKLVIKEAERYKILDDILSKYELLIHKAINEGMGIGAVDRAVEHQDIFWQVAHLIFLKAHDLTKKGTAKLSTRLYALAETHVRLYYRNPVNRRHKLCRLRLEGGLPLGLPANEIMTAQQLASERAEQIGDG